MSKISFIVIALLLCLPAQAQLLDLYAILTGKTVLMPNMRPIPLGVAGGLPADLQAEKTNAITKIEAELAKLGIAVVQDGPNFVRLFPESQRSIFDELPLRGTELAKLNSQLPMRAGTISFMNGNLEQALPLYAAVSRRVILRSAALPPISVNLKTIGDINQQEAAYALATVFALNGVAIIEDGEKFAEVVPMSQRKFVKPNAPKPEPGSKLFDPKGAPKLGESQTPIPTPPPTTQTERELERVRKAINDFFHDQPPNYSARRLLDFYADLAGKTVQPSKDFDSVPIWFQIDMPLSKSELLYAIEETFSLNNLTIVPVNDLEIRLGSVSKPGQSADK